MEQYDIPFLLKTPDITSYHIIPEIPMDKPQAIVNWFEPDIVNNNWNEEMSMHNEMNMNIKN